MHQELRSQLSRYALAVAVVAVAAALTYLLLLAHIRLPFAVFYGAVIVGARYGGRLPRLLPLPPSAGARYFFAPPGNAPAILVFTLVAVFIWYLTQKHRHAEESLRRRERELTDFFENATVGLHWVGADGTILWTNRAELEMLGYARDEHIGHSITEFHADPQVISDILARVGRGEELHGYEARLRCKDGSLRHVLINSNVLWEGGRFVHTRCFTRDVTDRRRDEATLARAAMLLAPVRDWVSVTDLDGIVTFWNEGAKRLFGWEEAEMVGRPLADRVPEEAR